MGQLDSYWAERVRGSEVVVQKSLGVEKGGSASQEISLGGYHSTWAWASGDFSYIRTDFTFVNSSIPYLESSRPIPLCRTPPKGIRGSETTTLLIVTSPAEISRATFSALLVSVPQTVAPSPNSLLLASLIASFSSLTAITGAAGPNVSSFMILISGVILVIMVGA